MSVGFDAADGNEVVPLVEAMSFVGGGAASLESAVEKAFVKLDQSGVATVTLDATKGAEGAAANRPSRSDDLESGTLKTSTKSSLTVANTDAEGKGDDVDVAGCGIEGVSSHR